MASIVNRLLTKYFLDSDVYLLECETLRETIYWTVNCVYYILVFFAREN